jgi:hypothetical protein
MDLYFFIHLLFPMINLFFLYYGICIFLPQSESTDDPDQARTTNSLSPLDVAGALLEYVSPGLLWGLHQRALGCYFYQPRLSRKKPYPLMLIF